MNEKARELQERTQQFFLRVSRLCESLPVNCTTRSIIDQLMDSAGSTDSNYHGACKGRSRNEFISKVGVAAEEADESKAWLQKLLARGYGDRNETAALVQEAHELTAIFTSSHKTAKKREEERKRRERLERERGRKRKRR
jgi:four helix bundle protein